MLDFLLDSDCDLSLYWGSSDLASRLLGDTQMTDSADRLIVREFGIVISAEGHNPSIFSPAFLQMYKIVDDTWIISQAEPPISVYPYARIVYENGIQITSDQNKITFFDPLPGRSVKDTAVPAMAKKYLEVVPLVKYLAVGINPSGDVSVGTEEDSARLYIIDQILAKKDWSAMSEGQLRAMVNLTIPISGAVCNLAIEDGRLKQSGEPEKPVVIFKSNFHHQIKASDKEPPWKGAITIIDAWEKDIDTFSKIVGKYFINQ